MAAIILSKHHILLGLYSMTEDSSTSISMGEAPNMSKPASETSTDVPECVGTNVVRTETVRQLYKKRRILAKSIMLYPLVLAILVALSYWLRGTTPDNIPLTLAGILKWYTRAWPIPYDFLPPIVCGFALYCRPLSKWLTVTAVVSVLPINGGAVVWAFGLLYLFLDWIF